MLEKNFSDIYTKFKMRLYSKVFNQDIKVEDSLSAIEVLCVELIVAMDRPTINEFASFAQLSAPNAAYKINNLVKKGYINKVQSSVDKREYHLEVTDKYMKTYGVTYDYIGTVMKRIRADLRGQFLPKGYKGKYFLPVDVSVGRSGWNVFVFKADPLSD